MGRIQLANSAQAASRANREARIAARGTPSSQPETRLKFSATHCRHVLQMRLRRARYRARRSPNDRTPCEIVPSIPALRA